jgi:transcriptional regulator with XRE-family HTH domain
MQPMVAPWQRIDSARRACGLNQKEMAEKVGVSQTAVQKWRTGGTIAYETVERLAVALNTTTEWLLTGRGPGPVPAATDHRPEPVTAPDSALPSAACRYPVDCDVPGRLGGLEGRLEAVESRLERMETQLGTLVSLLGARLSLAESARGEAKKETEKRAG